MVKNKNTIQILKKWLKNLQLFKLNNILKINNTTKILLIDQP